MNRIKTCTAVFTAFIAMTGITASAKQIVHDAEYYILEAQNGEVWAVEDEQLDKKLAELREKFGAPPNIVHYMWDDQPVMAFGSPIFQQIRGYETPELNKLAREGMLFSRMCTEPGCTPSRSASLTGQMAIRTGTWEIGFPIEYTGFANEKLRWRKYSPRQVMPPVSSVSCTWATRKSLIRTIRVSTKLSGRSITR